MQHADCFITLKYEKKKKKKNFLKKLSDLSFLSKFKQKSLAFRRGVDVR